MGIPRKKESSIVTLSLLLTSIWCMAATPSQVRADPTKDARLKELLKERHATLKEIAVQVAKAYEAGAASIEQMHDAEQTVLRAELDVCETDKERIAVLEKLVILAKKQEDRAAETVKRGINSPTATLKARAKRLEAEIALERARIGK
jgi:hypothetical protein